MDGILDAPELRWLEEATIKRLQEAMAAGELSSRQLVLWYMHRIGAYDRNGMALNSVLEVNPDALHIAAALDAERAQRGPRGPMHGIPVLVKDNIDTADKMHTSGGSRALADSYATEDSHVARRLREAGAVILGKTNMTEWANFMTRNMPAGYSSRGGQVKSPYGPGRFSPGGSSAGSGSAVAANLAAAAIGTETSGSILSPASSNSIVGIKPTVGLVSRTGIIPIMHTQDTAGPMARTVEDAAVLLGVVAGVDERDPATVAAAGRFHADYTQFLDIGGLRGARVGIPRELYKTLDAGIAAVMEAALEVLRQQGAKVVDPVDMPCLREKMDNVAMVHEFKPALNAYLGRLRPEVPVHTLKELIEYNTRDAATMLRYGQTLLKQAEATSGTLTEPEYVQGLTRGIYLCRALGIDAAIKEHRLDALVVPGNWGAGIAARPGYPSVTVPGGYTEEGQPVGVTFTAGAFAEPVLIRLAYAFEQATRARKAPVLVAAAAMTG
ncbi:MAG: amidase family protein [Bacillota bacterium]|nr:amidase family protein [Bacillota bacterium]